MKSQIIKAIFSLPSHNYLFPNCITDPTLSILSNCKSKTLQQLQLIHAQTITKGLISMYPSEILSKLLHVFTLLNPLNPIDYALSIFNQIPDPSSFSYNILIRAYTLLSSPLSALHLFAKMRHLGVSPDFHSYPFALKACAHLHDHTLARVLHSEALKFGFCGDIFVRNTLIHVYSGWNSMAEACVLFEESTLRDVVTYNVLISGFVRAGETDQGRRIFNEMPIKDAVSWNTLLAGYSRMNQSSEAIELFDQMVASGLHLDNVSLVSTLSACAQLGLLEQGETLHNYIKDKGIPLDSFLTTGLVDMYAKCGSISLALNIFESSPQRNLVTWNAIIVGLAMHGHGELSLKYFVKMREAEIWPDGITFLGVLMACSHAGLPSEARKIFDEMESVYGVARELKHYGCMADLLSRAGFIEETMKMIEKMPMEGDVYVWSGLLGGCMIHGNVEIAEIAARHVMEVDPEDGGVYSIMANIYGKAKRWEDVAKMRRLMYERRVKKNAGCSLIQVDGICHEFVAGDRLHPHSDDIYWILDGIVKQHIDA